MTLTLNHSEMLRPSNLSTQAVTFLVTQKSVGGDTARNHVNASTSSPVVHPDFFHVSLSQKLAPGSVYQPRPTVLVHAILCFCANNQITSTVKTSQATHNNDSYRNNNSNNRRKITKRHTISFLVDLGRKISESLIQCFDSILFHKTFPTED